MVSPDHISAGLSSHSSSRVSVPFSTASLLSMRYYHRGPPIRRFDLTPTHLVEAANHIFALCWANKPPMAVSEDRVLWSGLVQPVGHS